jgi:hypothetical protein
MSKAHLIAPLLAKAADSSLTTAERSQAKSYAKKLQDQYGKPETENTEKYPIDTSLSACDYYSVAILAYATMHTDYRKLIENPLRSYDCFIVSDKNGNDIWITKRPDLANAAISLMKQMAIAQVATIEAEKKAKAKELEEAKAARTKRNAEQGYERVDTTDYTRNKSGGFVKATKDNHSKKKFITLARIGYALTFILIMLALFV